MRVADGEAQHAQRVVRNGVGQHVLAADVAGDQFAGTMKPRSAQSARTPASTKSKWKMSDCGR